MSEIIGYRIGNRVRLITHPTTGSDCGLSEYEEDIIQLAGERDKAEAACAAMRETVGTACDQASENEATQAWHYLTSLLDDIEKTPNPGQPLLDEHDRLADDALANRLAAACHDPHHDIRYCPTCSIRADAIAEYRDAVRGTPEGKEPK